MEKRTGISLLVFVILLLFTMVLHPAGGNIEHLITTSRLIISTHAIAILALPFGWVGFQGLTQKIGTNRIENRLAFSMVSLGLVAVLMAATINGIVLPLFLEHYTGASAEKLEAIKPLVRYGFAINQAFDYIYSLAFALAILCWSWTILRTQKLPGWLGWMGIGIALAILLLFITGIGLHTLKGLRIFGAITIAWIALLGYCLIRGAQDDSSQGG